MKRRKSIGQGPRNHAQLQVELSECEDMKCDDCDCLYFTKEVRYKTVPAHLTHDKTERLVLIEVLKCVDCGTRKYDKTIDCVAKDEENKDT